MSDAAEFKQALKNLGDPSLKVRRSAISWLRFQETHTAAQKKQAIDALIKMLGSRTAATRRDVAAARPSLWARSGTRARSSRCSRWTRGPSWIAPSRRA